MPQRRSAMLYAKVVFGLPLEGPFDYIVGKEFEGKISAGSRVSVTFGPKKMIGYVVELTDKSKIRNLKKIINLLDDSAILDKNMLKLTKQLSEYYCCSWGEAIETALPEPLRRGKVLNGG
jgi:primosomal protein N' (replication factor Y)